MKYTTSPHPARPNTYQKNNKESVSPTPPSSPSSIIIVPNCPLNRPHQNTTHGNRSGVTSNHLQSEQASTKKEQTNPNGITHGKCTVSRGSQIIWSQKPHRHNQIQTDSHNHNRSFRRTGNTKRHQTINRTKLLNSQRYKINKPHSNQHKFTEFQNSNITPSNTNQSRSIQNQVKRSTNIKQTRVTSRTGLTLP